MRVIFIPNIMEKKDRREFNYEFSGQTLGQMFDDLVGKDRKGYVAIIAGAVVDWDQVPKKSDIVTFAQNIEADAIGGIFGAVLTVVGLFVPGLQFLLPIGLGMLAGAAVFAEAYPNLKRTILGWGDFGKITLPQVLGVNHWFVIPVFVIGGLVLFRWFEKKGL